MRYLLLALALVTTALAADAQRGWEAGAGLGVGHYFGDLNTSLSLDDPGLNVTALARYNFSNRWAARIKGSYMRVAGSDANSANAYERARNLSFASDVIDGALGMEFNFLPYDHGDRDNFWTPYVFASFMVSSFQPEAELDGVTYRLRDFGTEGQLPGEEYYTTALGLSYGLGFKLDLTYEWSLNFELNARQLFSDYLDDVSTVYPDTEDLSDLRGDIAVALSDPSIIIDGVNERKLGEEGRLRGDASDNDQYAGFTVSLMYYFGDLRCPDYGSR